VQPVDGLRPGADQIVAVFGQDAQGRDGLAGNCGVEPGGGARGNADRQGVGLVGLRPCPLDSIRMRRASLAGTSTTPTPSAASRAVSEAPRPVALSIAQMASDQRLAKRMAEI
jgi:hypothetical protein